MNLFIFIYILKIISFDLMNKDNYAIMENSECNLQKK